MQTRSAALRAVRAATSIVHRGTSADVQLEIYRKAIEAGDDVDSAFRSVVEWLESETVR